MTQSEMLKLIARHGYNVGFGAKKNFATYDLIEPPRVSWRVFYL